jgi:hypothetical protein
VPVLDDPEQHRRAEVLLRLPALERGREVLGIAALHEEVDALGRELALRDLQQAEHDVAAFDRVRLLDQLQEMALELDRHLLGDPGEIPQVGDQQRLRWLECGRVHPGDLRNPVADVGAVEALRRIEQVAVLHGIGDPLQDVRQVGVRLPVGRGRSVVLRERDPAACRARGIELVEDLVLGRHGRLPQHIALRLLLRHGDAGILGDGLAGFGPPLLELLLADHLGERDLEVDGGRRLVGIGFEGLDDELGRVVGDQLGDLLWLRLLAHQNMVLWKDFHRPDAEGRVHRVRLLALEVDHEAHRRVVEALDLAEAPAPVDHIRARFHGLKLGLEGLK